MHDPMTVAWEIRSPIPRREPGFGRDSKWRWVFPTIITIWHVDPEKGGSDDSCDWCGWKPQPDDATERELRSLASWESRYPFYFNVTRGPADAAALLYCFWQTIAWRRDYATSWWRRLLDPQRRRRISQAFFMKAVRYCANETDNILGIFTVEPDTVFPRETRDEHDGTRHVSKPSLDAESAYHKFRRLWQLLQSERRPWWRHPRWHIHHWKIQVHALQRFKRWAFSRCEVCGKRFRYGESPTSRMWDSTGPQWFKSEVGIRHSACDGIAAGVASTPNAEPPVQEPKP